MAPQHVAAMLGICALWAGNMIAIREAVVAIPPLMAVALRYAVMLPVCLPHMRWLPGPPADGGTPSRMTLVLLAGLVGGGLHFGLGGVAFAAARNLSALAIAGQLGVPFSLLLAILLQGERIQWRRALGIALAFSGVALLVFDPRIAQERLALWLTVAASFCWALSTLWLRRLSGTHVLNLMGWQAAVSLPVLLAASLLLEPGALGRLAATPLSAMGWVVYSALGASLVGHAGMSWMLQRYPVSVITPLTLPTPVFAIALTTAVYRTPVTPLMALGAVLTLTGVAIIALRTARKAGR
ncbi:MAG: EamA family transporter [Thermaurantiacus sp.]|uniref:DMT family transporter n=1 Tax=Thermaurantiacus sp. TaxID=2820283 RepID=UPI00298F38F8|nr:EamA family transporter [Thermaurantiacus sp.]MDW8415829.1 EamA family transporter [Thermaurantiacus sp.]